MTMLRRLVTQPLIRGASLLLKGRQRQQPCWITPFLLHSDSTQKEILGREEIWPLNSSKDLLVEQIRKANNISALLSLSSQYCSIMDNSQLALSFEAISRHLKSADVSIDEVKNSLAFDTLCDQALKKIRFFDIRGILAILKVLRFLDVPHSTALGQAVLQMLRHSINDLDLVQINFLRLLVSRDEANPLDPLLEVIKMAIPLVLQAQLPYQLDPDNINLLVDSTCSSLYYKLKPNHFEKAVSLLMKKKDGISEKQLLRLFNEVSRYPPALFEDSDNLDHLCKELVSQLCPLVASLQMQETARILWSIEHRPRLGMPQLLRQLSHKAVTEDWQLEKLDRLLKVFITTEFVSTEVLELTAHKAFQDPGSVATNNSISIVNLVEAFSMSDYLPASIRNFVDVIFLCEDKLSELEKKAPHLLVKLVANLATLEAATPQIISRVMQPEFLNRVLSHPKPHVIKLSIQNYRLLEQVARIELSDYPGPFLPKEILERSVKDRSEVIRPMDMILKEFLEIGLGGPQFVLNNLWTKYGHFIDHLIVMRKGDYPVAIKDQELNYPQERGGLRYLEDLKVPDNSKLLSVMVARKEWFTSEPPRLRGWSSLQHRTLAKLGYNPVILGPPVVTEGRSQDLVGHLDNEIY